MFKTMLSLAILALPLAAHAQDGPCQDRPTVDIPNTRERVLVLGEMHGTNEFADLAEKLLCQLIKTQSLVILGVELPHGEQARINAYLASDGGSKSLQLLTDSDFWNDKWQDGRRSQAVFSLIEHVRRMRLSGAPVMVDAFDSQASDLPEPLIKDGVLVPEARDAFMAHHIELRVRQYPEAKYFALTGSVHASKQRGAGAKWNAGKEPMALRLNERVPVFSIGASWTGGMAWACWDANDAAGCKASKLEAGDTGPGFDMGLELGRLTASAPQNSKISP